jgi:gamma-glutamyltranspeptidase / glutathione hydrolase
MRGRLFPLMVRTAALGFGLNLATPLHVWAQQMPAAPEAASGLEVKPVALARQSMVAAANSIAVAAGNEILKAGGSAVDAAIAVQLVLNIVEPQSSGLGGGAFLVHWNWKTRALQTYEGRETAPASAAPERFLKPDGTPRAFGEAVFGGQSVGTPGLMRMLAMAHKAHGKLQWARLFGPALRIADDGFLVSRRLNTLLKEMGAENFDATSRAFYFNAVGEPHPVGHVLKSPTFAGTLHDLAINGAESFYTGPIAEAMVAAAANAPNHQGDLSLADLKAYRAKERPPVCIDYRRHKVCGMGPPSSGGLTVAMALKMLEPFDLGAVPLNPRGLHLIGEAEKLAYADRDRFIADADFVKVPKGLTDPGYLARRRAWIDPERAKPKADAGSPPGSDPMKKAGIDDTDESVGTSHISIVDRAGNAVAMTTTIENAFGSRVMAAGFLLNNQLTDFSFRTKDAEGRDIANAVGPGKRPRSSLSPTIIFGPDGRLKAVLGSPGGSRIILYVLKATIAMIDWNMDAQSAAELANFGSRNGPFEIEATMAGPMPALHMKARGHEVATPEMTSGLHIIKRRADGRLEGGADPRREGVAAGE